jgi:hypothetical protein
MRRGMRGRLSFFLLEQHAASADCRAQFTQKSIQSCTPPPSERAPVTSVSPVVKSVLPAYPAYPAVKNPAVPARDEVADDANYREPHLAEDHRRTTNCGVFTAGYAEFAGGSACGEGSAGDFHFLLEQLAASADCRAQFTQGSIQSPTPPPPTRASVTSVSPVVKAVLPAYPAYPAVKNPRSSPRAIQPFDNHVGVVTEHAVHAE